MEVFNLMAAVLDELYDAIPGTAKGKNKAIRTQLDALSSFYEDLTKKGVARPDYKDPAMRYAYCQRHLTCHANAVATMINENAVLSDLFKLERVRLTCMGGGPGSDFLGIVKHCMKRGRKPELVAHLQDGADSWSEAWTDIDDKTKVALMTRTTFEKVDVTDPSTYDYREKSLTADLFTAIYFMSEVYALRPAADAYFRRVFSKAKKGARILFIDNKHQDFYGWFDELAAKHGWDVKVRSDRIYQLPPTEEKTDLGEHLMHGNPKLQATVAVRIAVKK